MPENQNDVVYVIRDDQGVITGFASHPLEDLGMVEEVSFDDPGVQALLTPPAPAPAPQDG